MCMLNVLAQHVLPDGEGFDLDAFKIVYVAPMKALVQVGAFWSTNTESLVRSSGSGERALSLEHAHVHAITCLNS